MMDAAELAVNEALIPSKETAVAPLKFVPVIVMLAPPVNGPPVGLRLVTVGAAAVPWKVN